MRRGGEGRAKEGQRDREGGEKRGDEQGGVVERRGEEGKRSVPMKATKKPAVFLYTGLVLCHSEPRARNNCKLSRTEGSLTGVLYRNCGQEAALL